MISSYTVNDVLNMREEFDIADRLVVLTRRATYYVNLAYNRHNEILLLCANKHIPLLTLNICILSTDVKFALLHLTILAKFSLFSVDIENKEIISKAYELIITSISQINNIIYINWCVDHDNIVNIIKISIQYIKTTLENLSLLHKERESIAVHKIIIATKTISNIIDYIDIIDIYNLDTQTTSAIRQNILYKINNNIIALEKCEHYRHHYVNIFKIKDDNDLMYRISYSILIKDIYNLELFINDVNHIKLIRRSIKAEIAISALSFVYTYLYNSAIDISNNIINNIVEKQITRNLLFNASINRTIQYNSLVSLYNNVVILT